MRIYERDGKKYISVTSIIDLMFSFDSAGFDMWAIKNHISPSWVTRHCSEGYVRSVDDFYNNGWEIIGSEQEVFCDEYGYAGRFDALIRNKRLGIDKALGDIKTWGAWSKKLYKPNAKKIQKLSNQESMYRYALKEEIPMYVIIPQHNGKCVVEQIPYTEDWRVFLNNNKEEIAGIITKYTS